MTLYRLGEKAPRLPANKDFWVAPGAHVIGDVLLGAGVGIWFGATLRGDNEPITVGDGTNIQENCVLHTDMGSPLGIGRNCTIGHKALLHGCMIGNETLVGMGATILNDAVIGDNCLIGAGALVTQGKIIPDGSLVVGSPARVTRALDAAAIERLRNSARQYQQKMRLFRTELAAF